VAVLGDQGVKLLVGQRAAQALRQDAVEVLAGHLLSVTRAVSSGSGFVPWLVKADARVGNTLAAFRDVFTC
jgi:hypothetical protein